MDTSKRPTFDKQHVGLRDGKFTINTIMDRVVFGEPVFADDLWQRQRLHECSRRRNGECGLDVIVASAMLCHGEARKAMLTAEKAAEVLVNLARQIDPDGALATHSTFCEVARSHEIECIDEELRLRKVNKQLLQVFKAGMLAFLCKPRSIDEVLKAVKNSTFGAKNMPLTLASVRRSNKPFSGARPPARACCCVCVCSASISLGKK